MKNKKIIFIIPALLLSFLAFPAGARAAAPGDMLIPVGQTVGIELDCEGVWISGLAEILTAEGTACPAREAGLRPGDRIVALNGQSVHSGQEFVEKVKAFSGDSVSLRVIRGGEEKAFTVFPRRGEQGNWQLGLWLRDSVQGIGTVTYYDPAEGAFGALGHGVSLPESRTLLPVSGGWIVPASVESVIPGRAGQPGELCGAPETDEPLGAVTCNTSRGIFGSTLRPLAGGAVPAAADSEIRTGPAVIISTVDAAGPRQFQAEILRIDRSGAGTRQLTIAVTDPELLSRTGGIVQGMSGSPILQNGKLVGAVTHVLISDPTKGYGITMENMLSAAGSMDNAA